MSSKNKRVLIFSISYYPLVGGAEVAVREVTDRITDVEFDMVTLKFDKSHKSFEKIGNVNVYRIGGFKHLFPFLAFFKAWRLNRERKYTHAWSIMANWAGFAGLFFKLVNKETKFILTLQEGDSLSYIKRKVFFVYPIFKKIFTKADKIHAISNYLADWARDMGYKERVEVIPNGVDYKKFESIEPKIKNDGKFILITTSRLVKKNGVEDIIKAMSLLSRDVSLHILGSGPLDKHLRQRAKSLGVENRVQFIGFVDQREIPKFLHRADVFIRPSLTEGMGNSFIEAMAAGLPVIATPVGGIVDFLTDPDKSRDKPPTGLFVPPRDPISIAKAVERLIKNERLRDTLITNGKRLAREKYDWGLLAKEMKVKVFDVI